MRRQRATRTWHVHRRVVVGAAVAAVAALSITAPLAYASTGTGTGTGTGNGTGSGSPESTGFEASRPSARRVVAQVMHVERPHPVTAGSRIVLWGDSLADEARDAFVAAINQGTGGAVAVETRTFGGTATCDWLDDMVAAARTPIAVAVLEFSGNALTACMTGANGEPLTGERYLAAYRRATERAIDVLHSAGARVYLAGAPVGRSAETSASGTRLRHLYRQLAREHAEVVFVDAGRSVLDPSQRWTETLPCLPEEGPGEGCSGGRIVVRAPDGAHFCPGAGPAIRGVTGSCPRWSSGAVRYGRAMAAPVLADTEVAAA
jgi:hypothetical protein